MTVEIDIRNEECDDVDQVTRIVQSAFPSDAESRLVDALRTNGKAIISLVAVHGKEVVGHILFSPVSTTPPSTAKGIGRAPVSVDRDDQGQGIGSQLIQHRLRAAKEFGFEKARSVRLQNEYGRVWSRG